jgi:hypothetical protein
MSRELNNDNIIRKNITDKDIAEESYENDEEMRRDGVTSEYYLLILLFNQEWQRYWNRKA